MGEGKLDGRMLRKITGNPCINKTTCDTQSYQDFLLRCSFDVIRKEIQMNAGIQNQWQIANGPVPKKVLIKMEHRRSRTQEGRDSEKGGDRMRKILILLQKLL